MHNRSSSGEIIGFAHADNDADNEMGSMHSPDNTLHHRAPIVTMSNASDEQTDLSDSPPTAKSSRRLQLLRVLHEKEKEDPFFKHSFDRDHGEPSWVLDVPSKHSDVKTGGTNSSGRVHGGPALALWGDSSSQGFARDIEIESTHSSAQVQGELALVLYGDSSSYDYARDTEIEGTHPSVDPHPHEDTWQRSPAMIDPMFSVIVQGAGSLVAYQKSGSSPAKDFLLYVLVFVYVVAFLAALGDKLSSRSIMRVIALVAAALAFLMTMTLVVM